MVAAAVLGRARALYAARLNGAASGLPELAFQYRHFVEWQRAWLRTPAAEEQLSYWRAQLEGVTELPLRTDRPRPEMWTGRGARHPIEVLADLVPRHQVAEPSPRRHPVHDTARGISVPSVPIHGAR